MVPPPEIFRPSFNKNYGAASSLIEDRTMSLNNSFNDSILQKPTNLQVAATNFLSKQGTLNVFE
jgi:hypothetical protein